MVLYYVESFYNNNLCIVSIHERLLYIGCYGSLLGLACYFQSLWLFKPGLGGTLLQNYLIFALAGFIHLMEQ